MRIDNKNTKQINKETTSRPSASKYKRHAMGGLSSAGIPLQVGLTHPLRRHMALHALKSYQQVKVFLKAYFRDMGEQKGV